MQQQQVITMIGGLDLESPSLTKDGGIMIACENHEASYQGYRRVDGYERFDGRPKPSVATPYALEFQTGGSEPVVGDKITGAASGASGYLVEVISLDSGTWAGGDAAGLMILRNVTGIFQDAENLQVSAVTKAIANGTATTPVGATDVEQAAYLATARAAARSEITAVPGSGPIRGVHTYGGDVYAFRDNAGGTAGIMHKATETGWQAQAFGHTLDYTAGTAEFLEGETVTGGTSGATATIDRVVISSGDWSLNNATGYLVLSGITGTFSSGETITSASGSATTSGSQVQIAFPAGGEYRFQVHNFYGSLNQTRLYGVNGVGLAFEWDGTVLTPIKTNVSNSLDKPKFLAVHRNHLFLGYDGGHILFSGTGNPLSYAVIDGAGEMGMGVDLTGMHPSTKDSLIVTARSKISYITGNDLNDFVLNELSEESGAIKNTLQIIGQPIFLDDQGIREMSAVQAFGDWKIGTISRPVDRIINGNRNSGIMPAGSLRVRKKDQYRIFYSDGSGLSFYFGRRKVPEITRFFLDFTPTCFFSGEDSGGDEILFAGGDDGFVYQLDSGTSADGEEITAYFRLAFSHQGAPNQMKRYHRARIEVEGGSGQVSLGIVSNYSYGDPEQIGGGERSYDFAGGGGFWDQFNWNEFYWSSAVQSTAHVDLDSVGSNISMTMVSDMTEEEPYTISSVTIFYTPRRVLR